MADHQADTAFLEYKNRVVYSLLRAAARVGIRLRVPLGQVSELMQMAYFEEASSHKQLKMNDIAGLFGKSLRTVQLIKGRFRGDFFAPEKEVELRLDLAAAIGEGSKTLSDLEGQFPKYGAVEISAALFDLQREGRIFEDGGVYRRNPDDYNFYEQHTPHARIAGLNRQMDILAETVWNRLVLGEQRAPGVARSFIFAVEPSRFQRILDDVVVRVRRELADAEQAARESGDECPRSAITIAAVQLEKDA